MRGLYLVTPNWDDTAALVDATGQALRVGAALVQYRHKSASPELRREQATQLLALCRRHGVPFIVNDFIDLCLELDADGVHVGGTDVSVAEARKRAWRRQDRRRVLLRRQAARARRQRQRRELRRVRRLLSVEGEAVSGHHAGRYRQLGQGGNRAAVRRHRRHDAGECGAAGRARRRHGGGDQQRVWRAGDRRRDARIRAPVFAMQAQMKVIVLGAGVVGTASAWYLRQAGHEVTVLERQPGPALETSFANGCQISVSHAEPWANPATLLKVLRGLGREDAPLLFRLRADPLQWRWCLQFVRECRPARVAANLRQIVAIADYSRRSLQALRAETGIEYDSLARGILHFYTDQQEFDKSAMRGGGDARAWAARARRSMRRRGGADRAGAGRRAGETGRRRLHRQRRIGRRLQVHLAAGGQGRRPRVSRSATARPSPACWLKAAR